MENLRSLLRSLKKHQDRALTVVYYWPLGKSKTLELPSKTILAGLAVTFLLGVWGIVATVWSVGNLVTISNLQSELRDAKDAVFVYQATYENIFEQAYPQTEAPGENPSQLEAKNVSTLATATKSIQSTRTSTTPLTKAVESATLKVAALKPVHDGTQLHVRFKLENRDKKQRISGHLYAVAMLQHSQDRSSFIASDNRLKINAATGVATNPTSSETFSVKRFRNSDLTIPMSTKQLSALASVFVVVVDRKGNVLMQHPVAVKAENFNISSTNVSGQKG